MNKETVQRYTNKSEKLAYWATLFYAELSEIYELYEQKQCDADFVIHQLKLKVEEFDYHIKQEALKMLDGKVREEFKRICDLEERVSILEKKVR